MFSRKKSRLSDEPYTSDAGVVVDAPRVSADAVCKRAVKKNCIEEFDLGNLSSKCRLCVKRFFLESFPEEAATVKSAEVVLQDTRRKIVSAKTFSYSTWWVRLETLLKARRTLYMVAINYYGHGQVLDILDPCEDMHNVCDNEREFLSTALRKNLLTPWAKWRCYGLKVPEKATREVYSTKSISQDTF